MAIFDLGEVALGDAGGAREIVLGDAFAASGVAYAFADILA